MDLKTQRPFGETEISNDLPISTMSAMLNRITDPALIYQRAQDKLLLANQAFLNLSGYSITDLENMPLLELIPEEPDTNPNPNNARETELRLANGEVLAFSLNVDSLNPTNQLVLLVFLPLIEKKMPGKDLLEQENSYDKLLLLTELYEQKTIKQLYKKAAEIIKKSIKPNYLLTYRRTGEVLKQNLTEKDESASHFPEELELTEMEKLISTMLWQGGKTKFFSFEEIAEENNSSFLFSIPILVDAEIQALILAGGSGSVPDNESLRFLTLLGSHSGSALKQLLTLEQAAASMRKVRSLMHIQKVTTDKLDEGVIILTPELKINQLNPAAEAMLGYTTKEVFQQSADLILFGNDTLSTLYKNAQQGNQTQKELNLNTRLGNCFPAKISCLPVMEKDQTISIVLILSDLSENEKIQVESQQLKQRAFLGEVSAMFSHEVKNPINSISTGLQFIGMNMTPDAPYAFLIEPLLNDCQRLNHLVDSTLNFSKPVEYNIQPVDLSELIQAILDKWDSRMKKLNINYNFSALEKNLLVQADLRAIEQVFVNLISNAIQAMEEHGGRLNISLKPAAKEIKPPQCEIIIADTGPGIPEEIISRIFEPFLTTKASGTGLGLAITKRIVSGHNGSIQLESVPGGTVFKVLLPRA
ncbi:MAG: PAS domain-containing protein [Anaerolineaceae bacterium]|nr:PAS domain-containing protein [Anaerolineaceae bacterium]